MDQLLHEQNKSRSSIRQEANNEIKKIKEKNELKRDTEIQKGFFRRAGIKPTIIRKCIRPKKEPQ
jgi:hypothetical protein